MPRPTFIVFDADYSGAELARLLGVVVVDPCRPLDHRTAPAVPRGSTLSFMTPFLLDAKTETSVTIRTAALRDTHGAASLASLFSLGAGWAAADTYELSSDAVSTVSIERKEEAFAELMRLHGADVLGRLRESEGAVYMLVGFKTAEAPRVRTERRRVREAEMGASTQGLGAVVGVPGVGGRVKGGQKVSREVLLESTIKDERAFAGEYVKVVYQGTGLKMLPRGRIQVKREVVQKGVATYGKTKLAFGGGEDEDDDSDEEEGDGEKGDILF